RSDFPASGLERPVDAKERPSRTVAGDERERVGPGLLERRRLLDAGAEIGDAREGVGGGSAKAGEEELRRVAAVPVHEGDPLVRRGAPAVDELRLGDGPAHHTVDAVARGAFVDVELEAGRHRPGADAAAVLVEELDAPVGRALDELEVATRRRADGLDAP